MVSPERAENAEKNEWNRTKRTRKWPECFPGPPSTPAGQQDKAVLEMLAGHLALSAAPSSTTPRILPEFFSQNDRTLSFFVRKRKEFS
jgi:hypothetical protein